MRARGESRSGGNGPGHDGRRFPGQDRRRRRGHSPRAATGDGEGVVKWVLVRWNVSWGDPPLRVLGRAPRAVHALLGQLLSQAACQRRGKPRFLCKMLKKKGLPRCPRQGPTWCISDRCRKTISHRTGPDEANTGITGRRLLAGPVFPGGLSAVAAFPDTCAFSDTPERAPARSAGHSQPQAHQVFTRDPLLPPQGGMAYGEERRRSGWRGRWSRRGTASTKEERRCRSATWR